MGHGSWFLIGLSFFGFVCIWVGFGVCFFLLLLLGWFGWGGFITGFGYFLVLAFLSSVEPIPFPLQQK